MLPSRISAPLPPTPETEDIFSAALSSLFTDDTQNSHGTPGSSVIYHSPRFGPLNLRIPAHPDVEEGRKLFAHYLWNSGVIAADAIETASHGQKDNSVDDDQEQRDRLIDCHHESREIQEDAGDETNLNNGSVLATNTNTKLPWNHKFWDVRNKRVLELGAGTALPSLICALSGAASTTITDHPSSPALTTGAIEQNVKDNVLERKRKAPTSLVHGDVHDRTSLALEHTESSHMLLSESSESTYPSTVEPVPVVNVFGYSWGTDKMYLTSHYGKPAPLHRQPQPQEFDRIIIADCLWMPSQHANLVKTILRYLGPSPNPERPSDDHFSDGNVTHTEESCALVVAGFHTGRAIVRHFFHIATGDTESENEAAEAEAAAAAEEEDHQTPDVAKVQGRLKAVEIFELDVNGARRPWRPVREGETKVEARRWCVCAVLVRR